jgi:hypothetical protein
MSGNLDSSSISAYNLYFGLIQELKMPLVVEMWITMVAVVLFSW